MAEQRRPAVTASKSRRKRPASRSLVPGVLLGLADPSERKGSTTVVGGRQRSAISRAGGAAASTTRVARWRGGMISAPRWSRSQGVKACEVQSYDDLAGALLSRCTEAGREDSTVLVAERLIDDTDPRAITAMDLRMFLFFGGRERPLAQVREIADAAGLAHVSTLRSHLIWRLW
ncbi:hypothetical protein ABZY81_00005 [Streptomyces sp. NPDC006514]|uniref:hypothetical protein n=1 Tax=Streptomyces sp. NPDC006514 TaxID=3154308 RepID=UPI0033BC88F0